MKMVKFFLAAMMMATTAFAQSANTDLTKFDLLPVDEQAKLVRSAKIELLNLERDLIRERTKQLEVFAVGITTATLTLVGAFVTVRSFDRISSVSADLKKTFKIITGIEAAATAGGVALTGMAIHSIIVKGDEINELIKDIEKARIAVEAADRTYEMLQQF
jgi:hypothetical protein